MFWLEMIGMREGKPRSDKFGDSFVTIDSAVAKAKNLYRDQARGSAEVMTSYKVLDDLNAVVKEGSF